jgi:hypothetical protein
MCQSGGGLLVIYLMKGKSIMECWHLVQAKAKAQMMSIRLVNAQMVRMVAHSKIYLGLKKFQSKWI